jgi:diguanylate cyclase (GGDEF)-like protein
VTDGAGSESGARLRTGRVAGARLIAFARIHIWWVVVGTFGALTLFIGLFSLHMVEAAQERREAERWHVHTLEVLLHAEALQDATFAVMRGERGYLLTRDVGFLEPYERGAREAPQAFAQLAERVGDNPVQVRNLAAVRERLDSYLSLLRRTVDLALQGEHDRALAIVRAGKGQAEFDRLQESIATVEQEERKLLLGRRSRLAESTMLDDRLGYGMAAGLVLLLMIAALAALSALRAQRREAVAIEELRRQATVDELTGLPNRRQFMKRLEQELARARRNSAPLCLATLDIDHFKRINDTHGHPAGDAVLRQIAAVVSDKIRLEDSAARMGGEEFALILPHTRPHQAHLVCDRLRASIAARLLELPGGGAVRVTVSTGVAQLTAEDDAETLIQRSDDALYEAKERGRNQVRLAA